MKHRLRKKGQISIFAILIFPVLFMTFAISLNITLIVHDKINLQNSVDLAAYYGAMKQAEMLNAIAHVNYQIRQSWKLLAWRYRVLGTMGASDTSYNSQARDPQARDIEYELRVFKNNQNSTPYFVCIGHKNWGEFLDPKNPTKMVKFRGDDDNLCQGINEDIAALSPPQFSGFLGGFVSKLAGVRAGVITANIDMSEKCDTYGYNSWLLATFSFLHFRNDQNARKIMIYHLAKKLEQGKDLEGGDIQKGAENTFIKNLTYINSQSSVDSNGGLKAGVLTVDNSLKDQTPRRWLEDQPFYDHGLYSEIKGNTDCEKSLNWIRNTPTNVPTNSLVQRINNMIAFNHLTWPDCATRGYRCRPSAGLKKKDDFKIYYQVEAEVPYTGQIFLPVKEIKLKAKAIAKPFGGIIGPERDPLLPKKNIVSRNSFDSSNLIEIDPHLPNYSRYPGDRHGLKSQYVHNYWAEKLRDIGGAKFIANYLKLDILEIDNDPLASGPKLGDQVVPGARSKEREWELLAISPDLFDVTYFTILPYYANAYFSKVKALIKNNMPIGMQVRGDLGSFYDNTEYNQGTILEQIQNPPNGVRIPRMIWKRGDPLETEFNAPPTYKIRHPAHLLTGWNPPKGKYEPNNQMIPYEGDTPLGTCTTWALLQGEDRRPGPIANGCVIGGRTGYSVKLVKTP